MNAFSTRMLVLLSASVAGLAIVSGLSGATASNDWLRSTVYVTERQLGTVTAYDAADGAPLWTTKVGAIPIGVTHPNGTRKIYSSDEGSNQLSVLDRGSGTLLRTIPMGPAPHHLMASPDGSRIYVAEFGQNTVGVVDTRSDTEIAHYVANPERLARTHAVYITRGGTDLYATDTRVDRTQQGDVAHIDARTGSRLCNTQVGVDPSEILVTPNGERGYVSVRGENKVKELDLRGVCPVLTGRAAAVGTQPDTLQLTPDRRTLIVTLRGTPAQITFVDTDTFAVQIVPISGHVTTGHHWLSGNGKLTFVAVEFPGGLAVVDNETRQVVADYPYPNPPGGARAHGVFYDPAVLFP